MNTRVVVKLDKASLEIEDIARGFRSDALDAQKTLAFLVKPMKRLATVVKILEAEVLANEDD